MRHLPYKWIALSAATLGILLASINASIVIISMPAIFRGIHLDPLQPGNVSYLLWMLMGYLLVAAVLVVTLGRLGDIYGRVRIFTMGFAVFTVACIVLALDPFTGSKGAVWLVAWRVAQGVGGAMLSATSVAIITDAFPANQRGTAIGIAQVAALAGSFLGLVAGGVLAEADWRLVFWFNVPFGLLGTFWAMRSLREIGVRTPARIDWRGNATLGFGLTMLLVAITYGIQPYGGHDMGWTNPWVVAGLAGGIALMIVFVFVERHVGAPMVDLSLFRIRIFWTSQCANFLSAVARGGLQFMLIIWLQGIWLPLHGYDFDQTPLWAGIYLLPLTAGFLVAGPLSGRLSDRYGARAFATTGLLIMAVSFFGLLLLPTNFSFPVFAILVGLNGIGSGLFGAPNLTAIMNSVRPAQRGSAGGINSTLQNSGMVLSIGLFFSLMIVGLAARLPSAMASGLQAHGVPAATAHQVAAAPPVGSLFASFLGYNPMQTLLGPSGVLTHLSHAQAAEITGKQFFPHIVAAPFHHGLVIVFGLAIAMSLVGALASSIRGSRYIHDDSAQGREDLMLVDAEGSGATPFVEDIQVGRAASGRSR
ncbi:MAG: MFS transporter [Actinomycetes bacterium]